MRTTSYHACFSSLSLSLSLSILWYPHHLTGERVLSSSATVTFCLIEEELQINQQFGKHSQQTNPLIRSPKILKRQHSKFPMKGILKIKKKKKKTLPFILVIMSVTLFWHVSHCISAEITTSWTCFYSSRTKPSGSRLQKPMTKTQNRVSKNNRPVARTKTP